MALVLKPGTSWWETYGRCVSVAPEAFDSDRLRNLTRGEWRRVADPGPTAGGLRRGGRGRVPRVRGARRVGNGRSRRTPGAGDSGGRRHDRAPRPAGPLARVGDRQAVAAGLRGR